MKQVRSDNSVVVCSGERTIVFCIHLWREVNRESLCGRAVSSATATQTHSTNTKSTCLTTGPTDMDSKVIWSNKSVSLNKPRLQQWKRATLQFWQGCTITIFNLIIKCNYCCQVMINTSYCVCRKAVLFMITSIYISITCFLLKSLCGQ